MNYYLRSIAIALALLIPQVQAETQLTLLENLDASIIAWMHKRGLSQLNQQGRIDEFEHKYIDAQFIIHTDGYIAFTPKSQADYAAKVEEAARIYKTDFETIFFKRMRYLLFCNLVTKMVTSTGVTLTLCGAANSYIFGNPWPQLTSFGIKMAVYSWMTANIARICISFFISDSVNDYCELLCLKHCRISKEDLPKDHRGIELALKVQPDAIWFRVPLATR